MSNSTGAPPPLRKFSWPFPKTDTSASGQPSSREVTDPQDYYDALALAEDGFYPIGANGQWHGGIHFGRQTGTLLDQDYGLRCIADGEVIAWKIDDTYPAVAYDTCGAATYSTGFVLVRHRLALPATPAPDGTTDASDEDDDAPTLLFYSLYMHLLDWQGYRQHPDRPRPSFWGDDTYTVAAQANDSERTNRQPNPYLPPDGVGLNLRDATNAYAGFAPRGTRLRLGEEGPVGGYFAVTGIVGDAVLAPGVTQVYAFRGELSPVPTEPDIKDGVVVPETPIPIAAGALVGHLGEYKRYIDVDPMCSSDVRPLAQIDVFTTENIEAFIDASRNLAARLPNTAKTLLVVDRGAQLAVPSGTPSPAQLTAAQGAGGGPVAHCTRVLPIKALTAVTGDDGSRWWPVDVGIAGGGTASGWVRERDHAHVRLASPWEWPGFEIVHVDDTRPDQFYARHAGQQAQVAPDEQSALEQSGAAVDTGPIFRKLYEIIDDSGDRKITADELRRALRKPWLAQALSHLIVEHESEWSGPMGKWDAIDPLIPESRKADWAKEKERIASLLWWDDAKGQHGLPDGDPLVAMNLHAIGFIAAFKQSPIDCLTYRIHHHNGSLERITPANIAPARRTIVRYLYVDAAGTEHDVGEYTFSSASMVGPGNAPAGGTSRLVDLRDLGNYASGSIRYGFHYDTRLTLRPYIADHALASLLGAMLDTGYEDVSCNGFSDHRGHSIGGSSSHRNGVNGDFKYFRADGTTQTQSSLHIDTNPELMDEARQNAFNNALHKYGWHDLRAWRYTINGQSRLLNHTQHLVNHQHHLHLQGYNPTITDRHE
ncbi:EF-hand domain-containing protein [Luteimonas abyssi]|uniref:EF-hand domain-containing protein n=1 Tax=Luteimonas abyssi TaxID=1247514 RepID=UPI000737AE6B|nr:hypothetical protein [Luteimonas abyssi]